MKIMNTLGHAVWFGILIILAGAASAASIVQQDAETILHFKYMWRWDTTAEPSPYFNSPYSDLPAMDDWFKYWRAEPSSGGWAVHVEGDHLSNPHIGETDATGFIYDGTFTLGQTLSFNRVLSHDPYHRDTYDFSMSVPQGGDPAVAYVTYEGNHIPEPTPVAASLVTLLGVAAYLGRRCFRRPAA